MRDKIFTLCIALLATTSLWAQSGTCGDNLTWSLANGVLTISGSGDMTDYAPASIVPWNQYWLSITSVVIGDSVTSIGSFAFRDYSSLTSVTIGNSVTSIGKWAFEGCRDLTSVTIPNSVTSIGDRAFSSCSGLTSIVVESGNRTYDSRGNCNAVIETAKNKLIAGCRNTFIPNSVTSIGEAAFFFCSGLTSVTIPNSVTSIGRSAFQNCSGLTSVTIPNSVTFIDGYAFYGCSGLTTVTIGSSITSIGAWAFEGLLGLKSITCYVMTPPVCDEHTFWNVDKAITLYVPDASMTAYRTCNVWKEFMNILPIEAGIEQVEASNAPKKILRNGQVLILHPNGTRYDSTGKKVE